MRSFVSVAALCIAAWLVVSHIADAVVRNQDVRAANEFCRNAKANKLAVPACER